MKFIHIPVVAAISCLLGYTAVSTFGPAMMIATIPMGIYMGFLAGREIARY